MTLLRIKRRIPTWIGLLTVAIALLYCNFYGIASGAPGSIGTTEGWPLIYWNETTSIDVNQGLPVEIIVIKNIHAAAIAFNLLAATALLAGTGLTIERFTRSGAKSQFSLSSIFSLVTIVAIALGMRTIEPILFGHGVWSDRDMSDSISLMPPWPICAILLLGIAATLLQAVRSVVWLAWYTMRPRNFPQRPPQPGAH